jgi:hypothetical protein
MATFEDRGTPPQPPLDEYERIDPVADEMFKAVREFSSPLLAGRAFACGIARMFAAVGVTEKTQVAEAMATMQHEVLKALDDHETSAA